MMEPMFDACESCVNVGVEEGQEPCVSCQKSHKNNYEQAISDREECLRKANECVNQSRKDQYGDLEDNFEKIANLWNGYLFGADDCYITAIDVANMMVLLKAARSASNPLYGDNYVDMAGYAACAYELSRI